MNGYSLRLLAVVLLSIATATTAFAADDGNTQPKLSTTAVGNGTSSSDIIGTTNGTGNVKEIQCTSLSSGSLGLASVSFYVNGGSAQTLNFSSAQRLEDNATNYYVTIPLNVRFTSSIRVSLSGSASLSQVSCSASWGLD